MLASHAGRPDCPRINRSLAATPPGRKSANGCGQPDLRCYQRRGPTGLDHLYLQGQGAGRATRSICPSDLLTRFVQDATHKRIKDACSEREPPVDGGPAPAVHTANTRKAKPASLSVGPPSPARSGTLPRFNAAERGSSGECQEADSPYPAPLPCCWVRGRLACCCSSANRQADAQPGPSK